VQATASTKDLDRADILGSSSPEIWYQLHWQSDRSPVRELDPQCLLLRAVDDGAGSRFHFRRALPSTGRAREIRTQLLLYPPRHQARLTHRNRTLGFARTKKVSQIQGKQVQGVALSSCSEWWAVLGSNQWPLPCETGVGGLRINDMRAMSPIATGTWYHVMSFDVTRRHDRAVPKLSRDPRRGRQATSFAPIFCRDLWAKRVSPNEIDGWPDSPCQCDATV
jgi:hypothetical protein